MTRLTLLVRAGCHLCDRAKEAMARVERRTGEAWSEIDVTGNAELENEYGLRVPVVLLDGREHGYWQVEEDRLERDLASRPAPNG
ncbi:glutaredoxin family protein [Micromonospora sp. NPDC092111]|uniref:glutaredoxin family protein n=1 Tax=Micromonospora sp. NPDC092111 TaxID=3364289 RepID=UPI00380C6B5C